VKSNWRRDNLPGSLPQAGDDTCMYCGGLIVTEYYMDLQDEIGQIDIAGVRCTGCGEVIDPAIFRTN